MGTDFDEGAEAALYRKDAVVARYDFKFTVTDVDGLGREQVDRIGQAVALAGASALAEAVAVPADATTLKYAPGRWWRGIPPFEGLRPLAQAVEEKLSQDPDVVETFRTGRPASIGRRTESEDVPKSGLRGAGTAARGHDHKREARLHQSTGTRRRRVRLPCQGGWTP
jgi:hypothetical protein